MVWTVDNSGHAVASEGEVRHGGAEGAEKKGNAIWIDDSSGEGVRCWTFNILGGKNMWLGVATEEIFGPGYAMKGLLYGGPGNLSAGGGLVAGNWGPAFVAGDVVGMRLEVSGDHTTLAFSRNGAGLGVAYDIKGWTGRILRPVVSLSKPEDKITIDMAADCGMESMLASKVAPPGIAGSWEVEGGEAWYLTIDQEGDKQWWVGAMVANTISCSVTQDDSGVFSPGPVMGSRMLPPPHLQPVEDSVSQLLSGLTNITREGDKLVVTAGERVEKFSVSAGSPPVTKDKIDWMNS